ncbi:hypothetical protein [Colwellia hornerae]|uniref:Uncharacterized protein n=1 Tax=Colwellia hornerae TaxID=89402 RepID=A0A5C6QL79_9GAMM|nr:hypothetical protein [Colwellia hornerae]TWX58560.1 hypothetical protein ESZ28_01965 [Colwellia hornerae]TWX59626.1 hypothetical protein ESZ26_09280 [Colwellia hornerae]TWX69352.1 hypothetical protein ESZ27_05280 [Colwellia hornerae]
MNINLWVFLSIAVIFLVSFLIILVLSTNKKKIKELEVEALKLEKANLETEVATAVNKILGDQLSRIEVLEAIVTDKQYDLNEKITRL